MFLNTLQRVAASVYTKSKANTISLLVKLLHNVISEQQLTVPTRSPLRAEWWLMGNNLQAAVCE